MAKGKVSQALKKDVDAAKEKTQAFNERVAGDVHKAGEKTKDEMHKAEEKTKAALHRKKS